MSIGAQHGALEHLPVLPIGAADGCANIIAIDD
jgi:hypothetical protein